ncbi:MAG: hypothetical protein OXU77_05525, partial [Gammaproteobacteria bacterium]|nr:hypothetical protein [Gammaproteobacteria bacterium]
LVNSPVVSELLVSPAERHRIRSELDAFVANTPTWVVRLDRRALSVGRCNRRWRGQDGKVTGRSMPSP